MRITKAMQAVTSNGQIKATDANQIAAKADELLGDIYELLKKVKTQVGTHYGELITEKLNQIDGVRFDATAYHYNKEPEGQE